jgi:UDP-glucose 4-epimerase
MKAFLVTGCNGYIGSHMCYELRKHYPDCNIIGVDMVDKPHLCHLYDDFQQMNLCYQTPDVYETSVDCIFHFAALASVTEGEAHKYSYYRNNIQSSSNMIDLAIKNDIQNFIFSSTSAVYGEPDWFPVFPMNEEYPKNPVSVYAKTKSIIEDILLAAEENGILYAGILRYFNAAGRNVEANLYEEHNPETHLIPLLVKNDNINVYGTDYGSADGTCVRDYIHVIDICKAHIKAYEYMVDNKRGIVCNIGTGIGSTVMEVIKMVENVLTKNINITIKPRRPGDVPFLLSDVNKMKNVLTFTPEYDILSIISSMR